MSITQRFDGRAWSRFEMGDPKDKVVGLNANLIAQFWTVAADVFVAVVKAQDAQLRQSIDDKVS